MCDDHAHEWERGGAFAAPLTAEGSAAPPPGITRRGMLRAGALGAGALAVSALLPGTARATSAGPATASPPGFDGTSPFRTAQHIHARGSEGPGSMSAQATEAAKWVDVMWFTDHDWREAGIGAPTVVHFNSLTNEALPPNPPWTWTRQTSGKLSNASSGGIDTVDVSPNDPDPSGALFARAVSSDTAAASLVYYGDDSKLRNSRRTPIGGQTWQIEVLLREISPDSWGFLRVALSYHPTSGGRPPAYYFLEYRFGAYANRTYSIVQLDLSDVGSGGSGGDGGSMKLKPGEQALCGVVTVPVDAGSYATQKLTFTDDIALLFPDMIARDNSLHDLWLGATSTNGAAANVCFDYLQMTRMLGQDQFDDRVALTSELAPAFPSLHLYNGTEVSYGGGHRHWLGGDITLPTYGGTNKAQGAATPTYEQIVAMILDAGGLPMMNHPYGTNGKKMSDPQAAAAAKAIVSDLLSSSAEGGLQGIEVFYRERAGASLEQHWLLYRLAVRNGLVLTATGVSDDHWGRVGSWNEETNHFVTGVFSDTVREADLLDAQSRGRAYTAEIKSYMGELDISLDDDVMGQIGVRPHKVTRQLTVQANSLPKGSYVEVWQIPVDLGGLDDEPGGVVERIPASSFSGGTASVEVDATTDCAYAVLLATSGGRHVAGSNPIWSLTAEPTQWAIPRNRRAS